MLVQTVLKRKGSSVLTIGRDATIEQAARSMSQGRVGALVVTEADEVIGVLSHRNIVEGLAFYRDRVCGVSVGELMRRDIVSVSAQEDVKGVMVLMTRERVTHVPVLASGRLVGIISIGDVVKHRLEELELEANVLRDAYISVR